MDGTPGKACILMGLFKAFFYLVYSGLCMIDYFEHSGMEHIEALMLLNHLLSSLCKKIFVFGGDCLSFSSKHTHGFRPLPINSVNSVGFQARKVGIFMFLKCLLYTCTV